jgi:RimJ/RimL family protein N-acetyltransferase
VTGSQPRLVTHVDIRPWAEGDLPLLTRLLGDPAMTEHLGGPETPEKLAERHARYLPGGGRGGGEQFAIVVGPEREAVGWTGYWESEWRARRVWEIGWSVLAEHQGRGVASQAATLLIARLRSVGRHRYIYAFPSVGNAASNAVCRALGMTFVGAVDIEYPPGRFMNANEWRLDMREPWPVGEKPISE